MVLKKWEESLCTLLKKKAQEQQDEIAFTYIKNDGSGAEEMTYAELDEGARAIAAYLAPMNVIGKPIVTLQINSLEAIYAVFGILYAGGIAVPAYPPDPARISHTLPQLLSTISDSQAKLILTSTFLLEAAGPLLEAMPELKALQWVAVDEIVGQTHSDNELPLTQPETVAFIHYTSGSTGEPKGVVTTHKNQIRATRGMVEVNDYDKDTVVLSWLPLQHSAGFMASVLTPIMSGGRGVIMSPLMALEDPKKWLQAISQYKANVSGGPNFIFDLCVKKVSDQDIDQLDLRSWHHAIVATEVVRSETLRAFASKFASCGFEEGSFDPSYGLTEMPLVTLNGMADIETRIDSGIVSCGRPAPGVELEIVNPETMTICKAGEVGEIWIGGPSLAQGYWKKPDETDLLFKSFTKDTLRGPFFKTGDLGYLSEDELFITGRIKELIIIRGKNHYPIDIERSLQENIPECGAGCIAAFGMEASGAEQLVIVQEISSSMSKKDQLELIQSIREVTGREHQVTPNEIGLVALGSIPRTRNGKVQRTLCKQQYISNELELIHDSSDGSEFEQRQPNTFVAPQSAWEKVLEEMWRTSLSPDQDSIGIHDNFFQLGGDSLSAISIVGDLSRLTGRILDENLVHLHPTIQDLAAHLETLIGEVPADDDVAARDETYRQHIRSDQSEFPLEPLQQSFYINNMLGDVLCYVCGDLRLKSELKPEEFQRVIREAMEIMHYRHPTLRLAYRLDDDGPRQYIKEDYPEFTVNCIDLSSYSLSDVERGIKIEFERLNCYQFDTEAGENFVATLLYTGSENYRLIFSINHLGIDGFSLPFFFDDFLGEVFPSVLAREPVERIPQTSMSFKDYLEIKFALKDNDKRQYDIDFWLQKLERLEAFPPLPENHEKTADISFGMHWLDVDRLIVEKLSHIARMHETTLFSLLFATFFKLVAQWSLVGNISVNTPIVNRRPYAKDVNNILGCFTDILPVHVEEALSKPVIELAKDIQGQLAEILSHSSVSAVEIARMLMQRDKQKMTALSPIIFTSALLPDYGLNGKETFDEVELMQVRTGAPATWMDVIVGSQQEGIFFSWNYNRRRFTQEWVEIFSDQYSVALQEIATNPQTCRPIKSLKTERDDEAYARLNQTERSYGNPKTLHERFEVQVEKNPDATAIKHNDHDMTYAQLNMRANQYAHTLLEKGATCGDFVAILSDRSSEFVAGILGILKIGAAYVPIDPGYPDKRQQYILRDSEAKVLLIESKYHKLSDEWVADCRQLNHVISLDDISLSGSTHDPQINVDSKVIAYMIYTSGSTGDPKGVMISHCAVDNRLQWMQEIFEISGHDTIAQKTSQSFDVSVWELFWPLQQGSRMLIIDSEAIMDPFLFQSIINKGEVSVMHFVPSMFMVFLEVAESMSEIERAMPCLRWVVASGEALPAEAVRRWQRLYPQIPVANLYGPTEAAIDVTYQIVSEALPDDATQIPIGRPVANTQILILDKEGHVQPAEVPGEICLGGVQLAEGYWHKPELSAEKFIDNPDESTRKSIPRLYRTGDLGVLDGGGVIQYLGRLDHQVKVRGFRIELGEIEAALLRHPAVSEAAVVAQDGKNGQKRLVAFVKPSNGSISSEELKSFIAQSLPEYMVPSFINSIEAMPHNSNGKIDRKNLISLDCR